MSRNATLEVGIIWKAISISQPDGDPVKVYFRGLSPSDISCIMREDGGIGLGMLYDRIITTAKTPEEILEIGTKLFEELPDLAAHVIARAAEQHDQWEMVLDWAAGSQLEALKTIADLTFQSESVGKKLTEIVRKYAKEMRPAPHTQSVSKTGSGDSAEA